VTVRVAFNRDGTVASARIIKRSGDPDMDDSVQSALDRVTTVGASFPEGTSDAERTFEFNFRSRTKLTG
jgi:TonB family protein